MIYESPFAYADRNRTVSTPTGSLGAATICRNNNEMSQHYSLSVIMSNDVNGQK